MTNQYLDPFVRGLTCDETNSNFTAGKGIVKYDYGIIQDYGETYLGDLPPDLHCLGDITYRLGKFYMTAIGNKLVEVNMKDPSKSQVIYEFPPGTLPIHGLTTVQLDCDSVVTYAIGREYTYSKIYELDFDDWSLTEVCEVPRVVTGAGNETECALPPCALFVDLDHDNSSIAFWGNYCAEPFCQGPVAVTDTDVVILSMANTLDSLELVLSGILDGSAEYLETNISNANLTVLGNGSGGIKFLNNGPATLADFEAALGSVLFLNTAIAQTYGMRQVKVTGWSEGEASILSTADLPLSNDVLKTTATATMPTCHGSQDGGLLAHTTAGNAPYSYQWQIGVSDSLLTGIAAGSYIVTVSDAGGCLERDTFTLTEPSVLTASIGYNGLPILCNESGELSALPIGGTPPYSYDWSNGTTNATNANLGPGNYLLTVLDSNGCGATASYAIAAGDSVLVKQAASICLGQTLEWQGQVLASDTTFCETFTLPNGCDSTICLSLTVHPKPQLQILSNGSLCNGNEVELTVGSGFEAVQWSTGATGQTIMVASEGNYWATVTNSFGCTATSSIAVLPSITLSLTLSDPTCSGLSDGWISIETPSGGSPPFQFSIDGTNFSATGVFDDLPAGDYQPSIMDATGCELTGFAVLTEPPPLSIDAGPDASIVLGESVNLNATPSPSNLSVTWKPTDFLDCAVCISPISTPPYSIEYTATVSFGNGCEASDTVSITVEEPGAYYIPTAFSPNEDGYNEWFMVFSGKSVARIVSMDIYDRKGGLAFSAKEIPLNQLDKGWNGRIGEEAAQSGVYTYKIVLEFVDGKEETVVGTVLLQR